MRAYDMTRAVQDLRYLDFCELSCPSGLSGAHLKAREGTGAHAICYKLSSYNRKRGVFGNECVNELVACRLMDILGVSHVKQRLVHAIVDIAGTEQTTWLLRSKSFRAQGEETLPLALYYEIARKGHETPLEMCERMGWHEQVAQMMLVDFLVANTNRTGANVEVVRTRTGAVRLAPLFSNGHSLVDACTRGTGTGAVGGGNAASAGGSSAGAGFDPALDVDADNYLGSRSLEENLAYALDAPIARGLAQSDRDALLLGLGGIVPAWYSKATWQIIWRRWEVYARLRNL